MIIALQLSDEATLCVHQRGNDCRRKDRYDFTPGRGNLLAAR